MFFKNTLFAIFFLLITNCTTGSLVKNKKIVSFDSTFSNKGFALIYNEDLYDDGIISKKIDNHSLIIFQKNLKKNTPVKITNMLNNKSLIAKIGMDSDYPAFNNSVLSLRIANELELNFNEPYVEIVEIPKNSIFVAKKAKTYDEEKKVASKAPVKNISINDLNKVENNSKKIFDRKFSYEIKIADFFFHDTAKIMVYRIINETSIRNPKIKKITDEKYRVFLGSFDNINSLQKSYNDINILEFENIEIIRND